MLFVIYPTEHPKKQGRSSKKSGTGSGSQLSPLCRRGCFISQLSGYPFRNHPLVTSCIIVSE
jgi:hypothetical protein